MRQSKAKQKAKKKVLIILIMIMLVLILAAAVWILHAARAKNAAREAEEAKAAEAVQQEAEIGRAEEEAIAKQEAEAASIASHVYSYRGKAGSDEHTLKAYDQAIKDGSHYISVDVVISSDKILYVSSELNALSMTGYNGMYEYISSETIDGLKTAAGNNILRLSDVFDKYGDSINYVIELKPDSDSCIEAFEKMVDEYGLADVITVQSMHASVLGALEDKYPDMPKLFVCWNQGDFNYVLDLPYVDIISVRATVETGIFTESNCRAAHDAGKQFGAWTLDTEEDIKHAIDMGVDNYFTNETALALSVEREYGLSVRSAQ